MPWYKNWFDSPYYHILYKRRNEKEAERLLDSCLALLKPQVGARILDLGCGKGRHSLYLNKKGFDVTGIDLSEHSIQFASQFENNTLHFYLHDMRKPYRINYYDIALNLFTSFGYAIRDKENEKVIRSAYKSLKSGGIFILDFMNSKKVMGSLVKKEELKEDGVCFRIARCQENNFIKKTIEVEDGGETFCYTEEVRAYTVPQLENLFERNGFKILYLFGNYDLKPFDEKQSDRVIFIVEKTTEEKY